MDERWPELFHPAMKKLMAEADHAAEKGDEEASKIYLYVALHRLLVLQTC